MNSMNQKLFEKSDLVTEGKQTFQIGDQVITTKKNRVRGESIGGKIIGWGKWRHYTAAKVKRSDGSIKLYLLKNLQKISTKTFLSTKFKTVKTEWAPDNFAGMENPVLINGGIAFKFLEGRTLMEIKKAYPKARIISM